MPPPRKCIYRSAYTASHPIVLNSQTCTICFRDDERFGNSAHSSPFHDRVRKMVISTHLHIHVTYPWRSKLITPSLAASLMEPVYKSSHFHDRINYNLHLQLRSYTLLTLESKAHENSSPEGVVDEISVQPSPIHDRITIIRSRNSTHILTLESKAQETPSPQGLVEHGVAPLLVSACLVQRAERTLPPAVLQVRHLGGRDVRSAGVVEHTLWSV